jgi:hypothetical protein
LNPAGATFIWDLSFDTLITRSNLSPQAMVWKHSIFYLMEEPLHNRKLMKTRVAFEECPGIAPRV